MGKSSIPTPNRTLPIAVQAMFVQQRFPQFKFSWHNGTGVWLGPLQPNTMSVVYTVLIKYKLTAIPKIWVTDPVLEYDAPHRYKDRSLCLYWPREWHWSSDQKLSVTLIPWAALWLYYYELWMDTGEWLAESVSHGSGEVNKS